MNSAVPVTPAGAGEAAVSWPEVLGRLAARQDLSPQQAAWAMEQVLAGNAEPTQFGAWVMGLRAKGESAAEVGALVQTMLDHARVLDFGSEGTTVCLDVVGTGGDQSHTVNISTMAALVCAAAGAPIIKHGNRAASSLTGTADVLEALGVAIDLEPDEVVTSVQGAGIGFCFAQIHHPALRHAAPWRRELGVPTVFNILGPLTNPGGAQAALIGCANAALAPVMADVLMSRGVRALVVRGEDGLDEISISAATRVWDVTGATMQATQIDAAELGIAHTDPVLLRGGDRERNAELLVAALDGSPPQGVDGERIVAIRDAVAVNAAAALVAYRAALADTDAEEPVGGLDERIAAQLPTARAVLAEGSALRVLRDWAALTTGLRASR